MSVCYECLEVSPVVGRGGVTTPIKTPPLPELLTPEKAFCMMVPLCP